MPDMPTQMKIFLSHSSADNEVCEQLVMALRGARADVWYDEHNLGAGVLRREIMQELATRPVTVILLSKAALTSDWVHDECEWAYNLFKRKPERLILPVIVGAYDPDDFDAMLYLESMKRVEAAGNKPYPFDEMVNRTLKLLALTPKGQAPVAVTPQPAESLDDLLTQGLALLAQDRRAEALPFFQQAAQLDPNSFDAWFNLGATLNSLSRYVEALVAHERATSLDPSISLVWSNRGGALSGLKRYAEALAACNQALALDPNNANAWNNKGIVLNNLKRYDEALVAYNRALALDPNNSRIWYNKGIERDALKRYDEALIAYDQALSIDPNFALAWNNKGATLYELKRDEEALAALERALLIDPNRASFWTSKATVLRALRRKAEAQEAERRSRELGG
jgi:tetratricopeptide (TPR) repeat protein